MTLVTATDRGLYKMVKKGCEHCVKDIDDIGSNDIHNKDNNDSDCLRDTHGGAVLRPAPLHAHFCPDAC